MITVSIGGTNSVALSEEQLAELNKFLAKTPVVDHYNNDKIKDNDRIKLEAVTVVKTKVYQAG